METDAEQELAYAFGGAKLGDSGSATDSLWKVAALNYNSRRKLGAPFDEALDGKLGSVYTMLTEALMCRGDWKRLPALRDKSTDEVRLPNSFHLLLATAQGKGIRWGRLGYGIWPPPLVNYYRGFEVLTRKGRLDKLLKRAAQESEGGWPRGMPASLCTADALAGGGIWQLSPEGFVFDPTKADKQPYGALAAAMDADPDQAWIVKPSDGSKGENIIILTTFEEVEAYLLTLEGLVRTGEQISSTVVQRYVENPLLLEQGRRKFDVRCWVLLDSDFRVHLYRQGVLRTSSVAYDSDLGNRFAHLTNHCIAAEHADYGRFEPTNEIFYEAFDQELGLRFPQRAGTSGSVLESTLLPQIRRQVVQCFLAARQQLESHSEYYRPFQLFGFDFLIDDTLKVWLCEINASPAVAEQLLPGLVSALVRSALDPFCTPQCEAALPPPAVGRPGVRHYLEAFEQIYDPGAEA